MHSSLGRREFQWHLCVVPCASIHKTAENVQTKGMLKRFSFYLLPHHHPFSFSKQISRASWLLSFQEISSPRTNPAPGFQTCPASDGHEMDCKNNYSDCFLTSPVQVSLSLPLGYFTYFTEAGTILYTEWTIYQQLTTEGSKSWGDGERVGVQVIFQLKIKYKVHSRDEAICDICKKNHFSAISMHLGRSRNERGALLRSSSENWAGSDWRARSSKCIPGSYLLLRSG